jgi:uncharacterized membrane protein YgdD (TMEM256/DUF423 family)
MRSFFVIGIVFCLLSVVLGAFAAHGLKDMVSAQRIAVFQTGVQYQFYHGIVLMILSLAQPQVMPSHQQKMYAKRAGVFFVVGTVFFSCSLYLLAVTSIKLFGPITPLGGLFFIIGWLFMLIAVVKK